MPQPCGKVCAKRSERRFMSPRLSHRRKIWRIGREKKKQSEERRPRPSGSASKKNADARRKKRPGNAKPRLNENAKPRRPRDLQQKPRAALRSSSGKRRKSANAEKPKNARGW